MDPRTIAVGCLFLVVTMPVEANPVEANADQVDLREKAQRVIAELETYGVNDNVTKTMTDIIEEVFELADGIVCMGANVHSIHVGDPVAMATRPVQDLISRERATIFVAPSASGNDAGNFVFGFRTIVLELGATSGTCAADDAAASAGYPYLEISLTPNAQGIAKGIVNPKAWQAWVMGH